MSDSETGLQFDLEYAKEYGRQLFGGAPDTIGQNYVVQSMRHQFDLDKMAYERLRKATNEIYLEKTAEIDSLKLSIEKLKAIILVSESATGVMHQATKIKELSKHANALAEALENEVELSKGRIFTADIAGKKAQSKEALAAYKKFQENK